MLSSTGQYRSQEVTSINLLALIAPALSLFWSTRSNSGQRLTDKELNEEIITNNFISFYVLGYDI